MQVNNIMFSDGPAGHSAQTFSLKNQEYIVGQSANVNQARTDAYLKASDEQGNIKSYGSR